MRLILILFFLVIPAAGFADSFIQPNGFQLQELKPTAARVAIPNAWWFYVPSVNSWILSKEDASTGPYYTGMKISALQTEKLLHRKNSEWIASFIDGKKKENGVKVLNECKETSSGLFRKLCLETIEDSKLFAGDSTHVRYVLLWPGNGRDLVVMTRFSAPSSQWDDAKGFADVMERYDLDDLINLAAKE